MTAGRTLVHGYGPYSRGVCHLTDAQLQHGLRATYDCGCRCEACKQARHAAHVREYQPKAAAS